VTYTSIFLEGLRNTTKILSVQPLLWLRFESGTSGLDAGVLTAQLRLSLIIFVVHSDYSRRMILKYQGNR
jgi:hypothetical protein